MFEDVEDSGFQQKIYASVDKAGMIEPLTIACLTNEEWAESMGSCRPPPTEYKHVYLRIQRGNNRYRVAKMLGYTHIDCDLYLSSEEATKAGEVQRKRSKRWRK